ncbi:MAG: hypothetical protein ACD_82C00017G0001 [uncultured bacterium]|nr:MAG: hypothetical protein ACD_82C00017G0001 [uncultured bacterium]KKP29388.1 MAG: hypothetical protein UR12_C0008G0015 [candidate division TM6 bacterium GW2011_GWF2_30_66]
MRKNFLRVKFLSRLLFLSLFFCSFYFNISAVDDDNIIPDYTIEAPWFSENGRSGDVLENNFVNNLDVGKVQISENDINEINNLNLNDQDLADEQSFLEKINNKLPNLNISKEQLQKIIKIAAIACVSCAASYAGYKIICATANTVKNIAVGACKSAAVLAVLVLIVKFATGK